MEKKTIQSIEIERKFLVTGDDWKSTPGIAYRQGYISEKGATVRARVAGDAGYLTIKGKRNGIARPEFEYKIPVDQARWMIDTLCEDRIVVKTRHRVEFGGLIWEVDDFHGDNEDLVIAEVELERVDQQVEVPDWIGEEVTEDSRLSSSRLASNPYCRWPKSERTLH